MSAARKAPEREKVVVDLTEGRCTCGCGAETKGKSRWRPGHDQRMKGQLKRAHLAGHRVMVRTGTAKVSATAVEAAANLDTPKYSWSQSLAKDTADSTDTDGAAE